MPTRRPAEVFPPGDFLREELEERGWTQSDLAEILGRAPHTINEIILGKRGITPETAKGLAEALGTSPELWMNLDAAYQLWRTKGSETADIAKRAKLYTKVPVREMLRRGWIEPSKNVDVLEKRIKDFFEVDSLEEEIDFIAYAARKSTTYGATTPEQTAWLFRAKQVAQAVFAKPYEKRRIGDLLEQMRSYIHSEQEIRHIPRVLSDFGIRFVIVAPLPSSKIDGACFWLDPQSPVVALSLRFDRIDYFWHTLMHEVAHVRNGDSQSVDVDLQGSIGEADKPEFERLADDFAVEYLIPQNELQYFIDRVRPLYSIQRIRAFAQSMGVHPGIVVGQLQHRTEIAWSKLRQMLVPIREIITASALSDGYGTQLPAVIGGGL